MRRYNLQTLLWFGVVVALIAGWVQDRRRLEAEMRQTLSIARHEELLLRRQMALQQEAHMEQFHVLGRLAKDLSDRLELATDSTAAVDAAFD